MTSTWLEGPALDVARTLPDASVDLIASSPPFLCLRDYNGVEGQWGSEATPAAFLDNLLTLATELRRVLAPHGSLAFELGDTYSGSGGAGGDYANDGWRAGQAKFGGSAERTRADGNGKVFRGGKRMPDKLGTGWPPAKSLCGVPTLFAWSLAYGRNLLNPAHEFEPWLVRNVIVWARNNPPVGALGDKVRPATSYITVACPSPRRWFDLDAVRGPGSPNTHAWVPKGVRRQPKAGKATDEGRGGNWASLDEIDDTGGGAPPLDHWHDEYDGDHTWLINTQGSSLAHYAMWPAKLAERLILAMCPREVCVGCGEPRRRLTGPAEYVRTDSDRVPARLAKLDGDRPGRRVNQHTRADGANTSVIRSAPTLGWSDCGHNNWRPGIVLDPFAGTGTTLAVADIHGRDGIGIDLDPINATLRDRRRDEVRRALLGVQPEIAGQLAMEIA